MALVITSINAIPDWLYSWLKFPETSKLSHCLPQKFWLEHKYKSTHYDPAGLFQKCQLSKLNPDKITIYLSDCNIYSNRKSLTTSGTTQIWLAELFEIFNKPERIRLIPRKVKQPNRSCMKVTTKQAQIMTIVKDVNKLEFFRLVRSSWTSSNCGPQSQKQG